MSRWAIHHLEDMPTLAVRRGAALKFEGEDVRVWLATVSEGGGHQEPEIIVERKDDRGNWVRS